MLFSSSSEESSIKINSMGGREGGREEGANALLAKIAAAKSGLDDDNAEEEEEEALLVLRLLSLFPVLPVLLLPSPVEFEFNASRSSIFSKRPALLSADVPLTMMRPSRVVSRRYSVMIWGGRRGRREREGERG